MGSYISVRKKEIGFKITGYMVVSILSSEDFETCGYFHFKLHLIIIINYSSYHFKIFASEVKV